MIIHINIEFNATVRKGHRSSKLKIKDSHINTNRPSQCHFLCFIFFPSFSAFMTKIKCHFLCEILSDFYSLLKNRPMFPPWSHIVFHEFIPSFCRRDVACCSSGVMLGIRHPAGSMLLAPPPGGVVISLCLPCTTSSWGVKTCLFNQLIKSRAAVTRCAGKPTALSTRSLPSLIEFLFLPMLQVHIPTTA